MKPTLKISRNEIETRIRKGNNCDGGYVLAVSPDGIKSRIHWDAKTAAWNPWPNGWLTIGIPALNPDGYGEEYERAQQLLRDYRPGERKEIEEREKEGDGLVAFVEKEFPEEWREYNNESVSWLANAFIAACNGDGSDLDQPAPWGIHGNYMQGEEEINQPPAEFEWE